MRLVQSVRRSLAQALLVTACAAGAGHAHAEDALIEAVVDQARLVKIPAGTDTLVIGNPTIADVTLLRQNHLMILTPKSFGETNFIALDAQGNPVAESMIRVVNSSDAVVVQRGMQRESYSCAPRCQPTERLGDDDKYINTVSAQALAHSTRLYGSQAPTGTACSRQNSKTREVRVIARKGLRHTFAEAWPRRGRCMTSEWPAEAPASIGRRGTSRLRRAWDRFRRDRRGITAVEFGLVAVPFIGLLAATFETGLVFFNTEGLEAAVQDASRNIMTGAAQTANITTKAAFLSTYVCPATGPRILPSFIDCSKLLVDIRTSSTFTSADLTNDFYTDTTTTSIAPGVGGNIVIVRVAYPMPVFMPILAGATNATIGANRAGLVNNVPGNAGWKHLLLATAVFQNEPF